MTDALQPGLEASGEGRRCRWRWLAAAAALVLLATPRAALAQPAPEETESPEEAPEEADESGLSEINRVIEEDRKAKEEARSARARQGPSAFFNPDLSFVTDVALGWFSDEPTLQTGAHDPKRTGFTLQQLELSIGAAVDPYFRFDGNVVFSPFGVEIEEAYATTLALPGRLQVRAGQFLTRFGRINASHPHRWDFVDQTLAIGRVFGGEGNRGPGVELSWLAPLPWFVELVASGTSASGEATARSFLGAEDLPVRLPWDLQYTAAVKQFFELSEAWSLLWGLSAALGPNPTGHANRTDVFGTDLFVKFRPLTEGSHTVVTLQLEWLSRRRQIPYELLRDATLYAQLTWRFTQRWGTGVRYELGTPARNGRGEVGQDYLDPAWTEDRHRVAANVTFWPTEFSRLRFQVGADAPGWLPQPIWSALLSFEVAVGAHGAHTF